MQTITIDRIAFVIESTERNAANNADILILAKQGKRGALLKTRWLARREDGKDAGRAQRWL